MQWIYSMQPSNNDRNNWKMLRTQLSRLLTFLRTKQVFIRSEPTQDPVLCHRQILNRVIVVPPEFLPLSWKVLVLGAAWEGGGGGGVRATGAALSALTVVKLFPLATGVFGGLGLSTGAGDEAGEGVGTGAGARGCWLAALTGATKRYSDTVMSMPQDRLISNPLTRSTPHHDAIIIIYVLQCKCQKYKSSAFLMGCSLDESWIIY